MWFPLGVGSFECGVGLEFSPAELKCLLTAEIVENPDDVLALMAQAQSDAICKLTKKKQ
jgi:hypothetical protein